MVQIDTKAYILRMFLSSFYFYGIFFSLYRGIPLRKKMILLLVLLPITFLVEVFSDFSDVLTIVGCYYLLKSKNKTNYILLNTIILSMLLSYFVPLLVSAGIIPFISFSGVKGWTLVIGEIFLDILALLVLLFALYRFSAERLLKKYSSQFSSILLGYLFLVALLITYAAHYYEAFDRFVVGLVIFLVVQTIFLLIVFARETARQKETFEQQLFKQQLTDLKEYADQLEENQQKMRKFQHDYKNLILSLKESSVASQDTELLQQVISLENYSDKYFASIAWSYNDLKNVKNTYLKSLLISKLSVIQEHQIACTLECRQEIEELPIPVFDFIRILGITLDNAIEAARGLEKPALSILLYQDNQQLECLVQNTYQESDASIPQLMQPGFSSKQDHLGLGLSNIQELKTKYPNLYVQYEKDEHTFSTQIITVFERK
ncbi:sensor histidine kinase [Enterococcus sp. AZ163]|uniref:sensor histidine kinase n=1 Tax=Enterococcus sp. AZ163 TaxID=2774638 RepID=UPI003D2ADCF4